DAGVFVGGHFRCALWRRACRLAGPPTEMTDRRRDAILSVICRSANGLSSTVAIKLKHDVRAGGKVAADGFVNWNLSTFRMPHKRDAKSENLRSLRRIPEALAHGVVC